MAQEFSIGRRWTMGLLLASASTVLAAGAVAQVAAPEMRISRDAGCGCCSAWAETMRRSGLFRVTLTDEADMPALKRRLGVPADLVSCHTATVASFVIEGHVPLADIVRLIETRPRGVHGLAVAGMPLGSPGMEVQGTRREAFDVVAFANGRSGQVFAHYQARA